jgi:ABC-type polysaccharide/polyol phosphate transport system ATPase subunit
MTDKAVVVDHVSKRYRLYHERNDSLKISIMRGGRARYEEFWALTDVSLDVTAGRTFGLIGENGSGKSTLLKCMARILRPDKGRIDVEGKVSALLELGAGFHPELSGRDNVYLNGSILGLSKRELDAKFDGIVEFAGLERFIDTPVKNYSSGMYVRLGFSVAINVDPDVLLVDEVLAVGDEQFQRRCNEKFADLKSAGKTIVIVSHALESVRNLCDDVAWLDKGNIREIGSASKVVDDYVDEVHSERSQVTEEGGTRWGSGEGCVERIELVDANLTPTARVRTGDRVTFRLHYNTQEPIPKPVFGMDLHRVDGIHVTGPNTRDADQVPDKIDGRGLVEFTIDRLLLLPGTYDVTTALFDVNGLKIIDHHTRAFRFDVEAGDPREVAGVVSLGGRWNVDAIDGR